MSRSGYSDDYDDQWQLIRWRGAVASALRGQRGQAFLREALTALDALPTPELIPNDLVAEGSFCTLGAVGRARGEDVSKLDPEDHEGVAGAFRLPHAMACEIMWENDDAGPHHETPRARWERMRTWIVSNINDDQPVGATEDVGAITLASDGEVQRSETTEPKSPTPRSQDNAG